MKIFVVTFYWVEDGGGRYIKVRKRDKMKFFRRFDDAMEYAKRYNEFGWHGADVTEEDLE